jgi:hypothetical protein
LAGVLGTLAVIPVSCGILPTRDYLCAPATTTLSAILVLEVAQLLSDSVTAECAKSL